MESHSTGTHGDALGIRGLHDLGHRLVGRPGAGGGEQLGQEESAAGQERDHRGRRGNEHDALLR